jgi:hypothetical protein
VTLINPNHVDALLYPFRLVTNPEIKNSILELRSPFHPDFRGSLFLPLLLLAASWTLAVALGSGRARHLSVLLPAIAFGALGLRTVRSVTEFAVLVPAVVGLNGAWMNRRSLGAIGVPLVVVSLGTCLAAVAIHTGVPMGREGVRKAGLGSDPRVAPREVVQFIKQSRPSGHVFNVFGYGGFFIHELWPEWKVFVDGRLDVFPPGFLDAYGRLIRTGEGWDAACRKYDITMAVVDYRSGRDGDSGLRQLLRTDPAWCCVFFSRNATVYAKRVRENQEIIDRYGCPLDPGLRTPEVIWNFGTSAPPGEIEKAVSAMKAMVEVAPDDMFTKTVLGQLLDASGHSAEGAGWIRSTMRSGETPVEARYLLVGALTRADSLDAARAELQTATQAAPNRVESLLLLAQLQERSGDPQGAISTLTRAQQTGVVDPRIGRMLEAIRKKSER